MDDSKTTREKRLAAALRANLQRRKQQAREPDHAERDTSDIPGEDPGNADAEAPDQRGSGGKT